MKRVRKTSSKKTLDFLNANNKKSVRQIYAIKSMALANYIENFVEGSDFKQSEVAERLEMFESQLSKWLSGVHNMTLNSILKLESACPIEILNPAIWDGTSLSKPKDKGFYSVINDKIGNSGEGLNTSSQAKIVRLPSSKVVVKQQA